MTSEHPFLNCLPTLECKIGRIKHIEKAKKRRQREKRVEILHSFIQQGDGAQHGTHGMGQVLDIQVWMGEATPCVRGASDGTRDTDNNENIHNTVSGQSSVQFRWKQEQQTLKMGKRRGVLGGGLLQA